MGHGRLGIFSILFKWISEGVNIPVLNNGSNIYQFVHADDLADACVHFMKKKTIHDLINIGTGKDYSIKYYAELISKLILKKKIIIQYDISKPNGTLAKVMDVSLAKKYGWSAKMNLTQSILSCYKTFLKEKK